MESFLFEDDFKYFDDYILVNYIRSLQLSWDRDIGRIRKDFEFLIKVVLHSNIDLYVLNTRAHDIAKYIFILNSCFNFH